MEKRNRKQADAKISKILQTAKESAVRSFEMDKKYIDDGIKNVDPPNRAEEYILGEIEKSKRIIKGLEGFEHEAMQDLPVDIRHYDPNNSFNVLCATTDLIDGQATEEHLFRIFTMKYFELIKIDYLRLCNQPKPIYSLIKAEYKELAKKVLPAIKERIDKKVPDKTKGGAEIIKACFALKFNDIMVEFLDNDGKVCISNFYGHLNDYFDRSIKNHQAYQNPIRDQWVKQNYLEYDDLIKELQEQA